MAREGKGKVSRRYKPWKLFLINQIYHCMIPLTLVVCDSFVGLILSVALVINYFSIDMILPVALMFDGFFVGSILPVALILNVFSFVYMILFILLSLDLIPLKFIISCRHNALLPLLRCCVYFLEWNLLQELEVCLAYYFFFDHLFFVDHTPTPWPYVWAPSTHLNLAWLCEVATSNTPHLEQGVWGRDR